MRKKEGWDGNNILQSVCFAADVCIVIVDEDDDAIAAASAVIVVVVAEVNSVLTP